MKLKSFLPTLIVALYIGSFFLIAYFKIENIDIFLIPLLIVLYIIGSLFSLAEPSGFIFPTLRISGIILSSIILLLLTFLINLFIVYKKSKNTRI